ENADTNLTARQVEFAKTIHAAGTDLLHLISDILDLSKIESGTVTVDSEDIRFSHLRENLERGFRHEAERRHLDFSVEFAAELGKSLNSDPKRLQQILKNLLSNAFKFTEQGSVRLTAQVAGSGWSPDHPVLSQASTVVAFQVSDTGIGISPEKQKLVFEAFQQADAGTSRKYGGTGLGLAISRELAALLGGEIRLFSTTGEGSTFTLYLPLVYRGAPGAGTAPPRLGLLQLEHAVLSETEGESVVADDRQLIADGDRVILVVDDDAGYARLLLDAVRRKGFRGIVTARGQAALSLARERLPAAVIAALHLPDMLAWTMLAGLKLDPATRHIPVQVLG